MAMIHPSQFAAEHAIYVGFAEFDRLYPKGVEVSAEALSPLSTIGLQWLLSAIDFVEFGRIKADFQKRLSAINQNLWVELSASYKQFCKEAKAMEEWDARSLLAKRDQELEKRAEETKVQTGVDYRTAMIQAIVSRSSAN